MVSTANKGRNGNIAKDRGRDRGEGCEWGEEGYPLWAWLWACACAAPAAKKAHTTRACTSALRRIIAGSVVSGEVKSSMGSGATELASSWVTTGPFAQSALLRTLVPQMLVPRFPRGDTGTKWLVPTSFSLSHILCVAMLFL